MLGIEPSTLSKLLKCFFLKLDFDDDYDGENIEDIDQNKHMKSKKS